MFAQRLYLKNICTVVPLLLALSACVTQPGTNTPSPVVIEREGLPPEPASESPARSSFAVADLVANSQREYEQGHWQEAIVAAERALRIDRRQSRVYLILAKSYRAMGDDSQALQFVQQGLRFIEDDDSPVARELNWLEHALQ